jgi:hypothetical protein
LISDSVHERRDQHQQHEERRPGSTPRYSTGRPQICQKQVFDRQYRLTFEAGHDPDHNRAADEQYEE